VFAGMRKRKKTQHLHCPLSLN